MVEMRHKVSKCCSNELWEVAKKGFQKITETRNRQFIDKKIPQFRTVRDNLYKNHIPEISMVVAFEVIETGDVIILDDLESTPIKRFPPNKYTKLYETATVKVNSSLNDFSVT